MMSGFVFFCFGSIVGRGCGWAFVAKIWKRGVRWIL